MQEVNVNPRLNRMAFVSAAMALSSAVSAQTRPYDPPASTTRSPWYIGLGISSTNSKMPQQSIDGISAVLGPAVGATFTVTETKQRATGGKLFLGYRFNKYFAIEGGVMTINEPKTTFDFRSGLNSVGTATLEYAMSAVYADAVGSWPITDKWSLLGKVGVSVNQTRADVSGFPLTLVSSRSARTERTTRAKFGAGVQYDMNKALLLRGEWERYNFPDPLGSDKVKVDSFTASLMYQF